jgi:hypothetical protein
MRKRCPYFLLQNEWCTLTDYVAKVASSIALVNHENVPKEIKLKLQDLWKEDDEAIGPYVWFANARKKIREDFVSNPKKYLDIYQIPRTMMPHLVSFTQEYAGLKKLPKVNEQLEAINRMKDEIINLGLKHDEILSKLGF